MSGKPIIFSASMIRALLAGTKTQTRRVLRPQPRRYEPMVIDISEPQRNCNEAGEDIPDEWGQIETVWSGPLIPGMCEPDHEKWHPIKTPRIGDRLWVRETWAQNWNQISDVHCDRSYVYRADGDTRALDNGTELPWRPSIYMPRWASRLTLIVTKVRIQRLHAITEADAIAEGIKELGPRCWTTGETRPATSAPDAFAELWQSLHGDGSWYANPWVWAVSFECRKENIDVCSN